MMQRSRMMRPTLSKKIGMALLLAPLVVGCGLNGVAGSNANPQTDGGRPTGSSGGGGAGGGGGGGDGDDNTIPEAGKAANGDDGGGSITTSANDSGGIIAANDASVLAKGAVDLGSAGSFAILSKSGISTVPSSTITGNIGVSPAAASYITGFTLSVDAKNAFATSTQVTGSVFASDYASPTPSNLLTAIGDMQLAYTDAAGRAPKVTELGAGNIGSMTLTPGVYKWSSALLIPTDVTLTGGAGDVWIFQIAQSLTMSSATKINLKGGASPKNVFWQVAGLVDIGTTGHIEGVVLSQTSIALQSGASINGRLLAQTAVTIDSSAVVEPSL